MNKDLLIVDDDVPFRDRLSRSMEKKGFDVESFSNYASSVKRVKEKKFNFLGLYQIFFYKNLLICIFVYVHRRGF